MDFSTACLHFPSCMFSLLVDVLSCVFTGSSFAGAELHVPFQPTDVHSFVVDAGLLWDQLLQEFLQELL